MAATEEDSEEDVSNNPKRQKMDKEQKDESVYRAEQKPAKQNIDDINKTVSVLIKFLIFFLDCNDAFA